MLGPFTATEAGTLLGLMFLGGESALLLGLESDKAPVRKAAGCTWRWTTGTRPTPYRGSLPTVS